MSVLCVLLIKLHKPLIKLHKRICDYVTANDSNTYNVIFVLGLNHIIVDCF